MSCKNIACNSLYLAEENANVMVMQYVYSARDIMLYHKCHLIYH